MRARITLALLLAAALLSSAPSQEKEKKLYLDPNIVPLLQGKRICLIDDAVSTGSSLLAQMLRAVLLGDYVSYYLGLLNGVHPSPVPALGELKNLLASK